MLKRELGLQVELAEGHYGEFTILADDQPIVRGGALTFVGVMPPLREIREVLRRVLDSQAGQTGPRTNEGPDPVPGDRGET